MLRSEKIAEVAGDIMGDIHAMIEARIMDNGHELWANITSEHIWDAIYTMIANGDYVV